MLSGTHTKFNLKYQFIMVMLVVIVSIWWPCSSAYRLSKLSPNTVHINPNIRCPGKNEENIWRPCKHGGYIENPDPKNCDDRYVCYVGLNETCRRGDKCAQNGICTVCGICEKCDSPENCTDFALCPATILIKRLIQKRLSEITDE